MDIRKFRDNRLVRSGLAIGLGASLLAACAKDYEGNGDEFKIRGQVLDIGERSLKLMPEEIVETNGKAEGWFETDNDTRIHNNYENSWCNEHEVDNVITDGQGNKLELDELQIGDFVEVEGRIRESKTSCGKTPLWDDRPVFDAVHIIEK